MTHWNYRVLRRSKNGETWDAVHEVYYDDDGEIVSWSSEAAPLLSDPGKTGEVLAQLQEALAKPVLVEQAAKLVEVA